MSIEATCKTQIKDKDALKDALIEIYGKPAVSVTKEGIELTLGDRMYRKPRFRLGKDGCWELVYDGDDRGQLKKVIPQKRKAGTQDYLSQIYAKHQVKRAMSKLRGRLVRDEVEADGSIRMKIKLTNN